MMYLIPALAGIVIILLFKYYELKKKLREPYIVYVDSSGVQNEQRNFIDVWQGKTINFKIDKYSICISQLPSIFCLKYIEKLVILFNQLKIRIENEPTGKIAKLKWQVEYLAVYNSVVFIIYQLTKYFEKRRGFKKALYKKAYKDILWVCGIVEEILDYWTYVKKKIQYLSQGTTLKQTAGDQFSWNYLELDGDGRISIQPRYGVYSNTSQN